MTKLFSLSSALLLVSTFQHGQSLRTPDSSRRRILSWTSRFVPIVLLNPTRSSALKDSNDPSTITLHLERGERAGVELYDVLIGGRQVAAIKSVSREASSKNVVPGMIIADFNDAKSVVQRLRDGPFPVDLIFMDPKTSALTPEGSSQIKAAQSDSEDGFVIRTLRQVSTGVQSRRGDLVEFVYEARMRSPDGPVYDSSAQRGTGQPYQYVIGSGDLIPGVDLGLYDMRPGEVRLLESK